MRLPRRVEAVFFPALFVTVLGVTAAAFGTRPPIEQPLIREGDFAVQLVNSLSLATTDDESQAESSLAEVGIAPRNGWIADYPVTPDIVSEVQDSASEAAGSGRIPMDEGTAVHTVQRVVQDMGLLIRGGGAGRGYGQNSASEEGYESSGSDYMNGSYGAEGAESADYPEVDDYYYRYGPPVISYYVPPWDYTYLYSWVPWPFWWGGTWFGGYFVLNDFDVCREHHRHWRAWNHYDHDRHYRVSNHSRDVHGRAVRIDPANRLSKVSGAGPTGKRLAEVGRNDFHRSGRSIMNRDATSSLRKNTGRNSPEGVARRTGSNRVSIISRRPANAAGRNASSGRRVVPSRPSSERWEGSSGEGRNSGRVSQGYSAPRSSSGQVSQGVSSSGFRDGGSFSGQGAGNFQGGPVRGSSGSFGGAGGGFYGTGGFHGVSGGRH